MDEHKILQAARRLRPGTSWSIRAGVLEQAEDDAPRVSVPSDDEIRAAIASDPTVYREKRAAEYPPLADQLDAFWKGGGDADTMRAAVMAVKAKYPKPQ